MKNTNADKLVFVPGYSEPEKFEDAQKRYKAFQTFYSEYKNTTFPNDKNWKLEELADKKAPQRIEQFEKEFGDRLSSVQSGVNNDIAAAMGQLNKDNGWKTNKAIRPSLVDHKWMDSIRKKKNQAMQALGQNSEKGKALQKSFDQLVEQDNKNREIRKQRTFMTPDKYQGSNGQDIKKKAASLVASNAAEGGKPLRTTIISEIWKEETVWEWTDTSRTKKRWRTTRSLTCQVAAKTNDGVRLITIAIAKDKQSDGNWGSLYGNLHQYSDPMLEENVDKAGP